MVFWNIHEGPHGFSSLFNIAKHQGHPLHDELRGTFYIYLFIMGNISLCSYTASSVDLSIYDERKFSRKFKRLSGVKKCSTKKEKTESNKNIIITKFNLRTVCLGRISPNLYEDIRGLERVEIS